MAAALKSKAKIFKKKLDQLGCPYTEEADESWIIELMFKPGESRIRLLQWLFTKFDSALVEILDPEFASVESKMDSRIQRLLYIASNLGFCRYDDVDLIRGVTGGVRQTVFMEQLIDIVYIADCAEDPKNKNFLDPGLVSECMSLEDQQTQDSLYISNMCNSRNPSTIFTNKVSLLPFDIEKQLEAQWAQEGKTIDKGCIPDMQELEKAVVKLTDDMQRQYELLQEMRKHFDYQARDSTKVDAVCRTISLVLSELSQLMTGFMYCYENDLRHWCNKTPPTLTQLGPAFKRTHRLLQHFVQLLKSLREIRSSYPALNQETRPLPQSDPSQTLVTAGEVAITTLQDVVDVLEESIQHSDQLSSAHTTPRSSTSTNKTRALLGSPGQAT